MESQDPILVLEREEKSLKGHRDGIERIDSGEVQGIELLRLSEIILGDGRSWDGGEILNWCTSTG